MHVLLLGGTGLISTAITRQLVAAGHDVICFTRGESAIPETIPDAVAFQHGDRNSREDLEAAARAVEPDVVIDMICFDAEQARTAVDVFDSAGESPIDGVEQYVFCSTIDVYHRPLESVPATESALRESERDGEPVSDYAADKAAAESVFFEAHREGFATTVIRPWSTYGDDGPVLHTLGMGTYYLDRVRRGEPIVVHGDGTGIWGACHRDDVARAFVGAVGNEAAYGEAYHVTSDAPMTWNQYHRRVASALEAPDPDLVHVPTSVLVRAFPERTTLLENHLQYTTVFDNSKAKRDLGFAYTVDVEAGVRRAASRLEAEGRIDPWDSEDDDAFLEAWNSQTDRIISDFA